MVNSGSTRVRLAYQAALDLGAFSRGTTDAFSVVRLVIFHVTGAVARTFETRIKLCQYVFSHKTILTFKIVILGENR